MDLDPPTIICIMFLISSKVHSYLLTKSLLQESIRKDFLILKIDMALHDVKLQKHSSHRPNNFKRYENKLDCPEFKI